MSEMTGRTLNEYREIFDVCTQLMTKVQSIPQPVIAQVQGIATAAGCQLVASCDLAIASGTNLRSTTMTNFSGSVAPVVALNDIVVARGSLARVVRLDVAIGPVLQLKQDMISQGRWAVGSAVAVWVAVAGVASKRAASLAPSWAAAMRTWRA